MLTDRAYDSMAAREIIELHELIEDWVTGRCPDTDEVWTSRLSDRFIPGFHIIMPAGALMRGDGLWGPMRAAYGRNPDFRIQIRNIDQRVELEGGASVWTYEEWQRNALNSTPKDNGRTSSAVFVACPRRDTGLQWAHIHETWLPDSTVEAHVFDW